MRATTRFVSLGTVLVALTGPGSGCRDAVAPPREPLAAVAAASNDYLVMLRPAPTDVAATAARLAAEHRGRLKRTWRGVGGFLAELAPADAAALASRAEVEAVAPNTKVAADAVQNGAPWGLDRIDQRAGALNGQYVFGATGLGIHVYVIDSGIRAGHVEFGGRAGGGTTFVFDGNGTGDCHGHGTHVASIVGGGIAGVAKQVLLHPVRVLDCAGVGSAADLIDGIEWVMNNDVAPAVTNISVGGPFNAAVNIAVNDLVTSGNVVAVSAGNTNANACARSPASTGSALTVGASTVANARAGYSSFGGCLDLFAPGSDVLGASAAGNGVYVHMSGTSMAAPHVAGAAAKLRQLAPALTPAQVGAALADLATPNALAGVGIGSPNRLLFSR
jgi:subtilisin family serine protease